MSAGGKPRVMPYWDLAFAPDDSIGADEWATILRQELERSVRRQLASDVPLGVFLRGGVDSSAIAAIATKGGGRTIKNFSLGFAEPSYQERPSARTVARHCGAV